MSRMETGVDPGTQAPRAHTEWDRDLSRPPILSGTRLHHRTSGSHDGYPVATFIDERELTMPPDCQGCYFLG